MTAVVAEQGGKLQATHEARRLQVLDAARACFARSGFRGASMQEICAEAKMSPGALYRYFPTKEELLFTLMREHMEALATAWEAQRPATDDPAARLAAFVENHIAFHIARRHSTHVSNMELRSLSPERLTVILRLRTAYEKELRAILREGAESGAFAVDDAGLTAMALIQMLTGVIVWFRPGERLSAAEVTQNYLSMTMRLVGAKIDTHGIAPPRGSAKDAVSH